MAPERLVSLQGILDPAGGAQKFRLSRRAPAPELAPFIERHWRVEWDLRGEPPYRQEVLTHPCVNLVWEREELVVHGATTGRFGALLEGTGRVLGTLFSPGAFRPFVPVDAVELADRAVPLRELLDARVPELEDALREAPDDDERLVLIERFLIARDPVRDANVEAVAQIIGRMLNDRSLTRVEQVCAALEVPLRSMQRLFRRYVGVSPKWVLQRYRIHEAAERLSSGQRVVWTEVAAELGYFDQAHFIKDFTAAVGCTPTAYAARCAKNAADRA